MGGALAARLLKDARVDQLVALVRAADAAQATERLVRSLQRFDVPLAGVERLQVVQGALGAFDLPADVRDRLTHVIHAAAHTSLRSVRTSRETNVEGTRALARAVERAPKLKRLVFIGTAYRCGALDVPVVDEDMPASGTHVVEYTRTKAEAESILEGLDLPLVIARPSIVIGHTRLGVAPSASLFWYYRALARVGVAPFSDSFRRDIVPVDWVADALVDLTLRDRLTFTRYHLSAGEGASETWASVRAEFVRLAGGPSRSERVEPSKLTEHPGWGALGLHPRTVAAVEACALFAVLPFGVFSNRRLLAEGVASPPRFTGYLRRCVETCAGTIDEQALDDVYLGVVRRPRATFDALMTDDRRLRLGALALSGNVALYTLVYVFLALGHGRPTVFRPWLAIDAESYYRWNVFLLAPSMVMSWILAAAVAQLFARLFGGKGTFEDALSVFGFGSAIASWWTLLHDLVTAFLGAVGIVNQRAYEDAMNAPTIFRALLWLLMAGYLAAFVVLFSKGIAAAQRVGRVASGILGTTAFVTYQLVFVIFNR